MEKEGVDFGGLTGSSGKNRSLPPVCLIRSLNHVFFNHAKEKADNERPFIYHRWGGLGSHRYPLGFSGDTFITWETLRFLPYFTATASNVNYGYWGHDIGGHMFKKKPGVTTLNFIYAGCSMVCSLRYSRLIPPKTVIS